ncbi:MAG: diaminopimelate epimerase [SAR324 cluster bacterium]|nr:diaminopimelate epimerase [SAR324 cluster bacterium]
MKFYKYHALGNDYLVLDPADFSKPISAELTKRVCHRNFGIGSDGILWGPLQEKKGCFGLRIFNPDGSEAEKSGNGLRIFSRYLWDRGLVHEEEFIIDTPGGQVVSRVHEEGRMVTVAMGQVSFDSEVIPVSGPSREVIDEKMIIEGEEIRYCAATIGNPHCVLIRNSPSEEEARRLGPVIENDTRFPNRTNVQFMKILDRHNIQIHIWERGAGYTLASGSSSSAAASVAYKLGLCDSMIAVHTPGGKVDITVFEDFSVSMTGSVTKVAEGLLAEEALQQ